MVYGCTMTLHDEQMPDDVTDDEAFMLDRKNCTCGSLYFDEDGSTIHHQDCFMIRGY